MVSFKEYKLKYHGAVIQNEDTFWNALNKSEAFLRYVTFGRIDNYEGAGKDMALYELCDIIHISSEHEGIVSENTDGYSVSYCNDSAKLEKRMYSVSLKYLPPYLFYRGI